MFRVQALVDISVSSLINEMDELDYEEFFQLVVGMCEYLCDEDEEENLETLKTAFENRDLTTKQRDCVNRMADFLKRVSNDND